MGPSEIQVRSREVSLTEFLNIARFMKSALVLSLTFAIALSPQIATAQVTYHYPSERIVAYCRPQYIQFGLGDSGEMISVDNCSIQKVSGWSADFVYYLDNERIFAQAKCADRPRHWYTFDDRVNPNGQPVYPRSSASQAMLNYVCSSAGF